MSEKVNPGYMKSLLNNIEVTDSRYSQSNKGGLKEKYLEQEKAVSPQIFKEKRKEQSKKMDEQKFLLEKDNERLKAIEKVAQEQRYSSKQDSVPSNKKAIEMRINKGLPSLFECAQRLKSKVQLINYNDCLYYYNGRCYDSLNSMGVVTLYREYVDCEISGEKNLRNILQLHKFLITDSDIRVNKVNGNIRIAVLNNGIFDVVKQKLYRHNPNIFTFSYIDADYVESGSCKHFDRFISETAGGDEILIARLWMFLGYLLMQTMEAKAFFVMGEAPDSGKSLLGNFIESLFPTKYVSNVALNDFNKEFSLAPIVGAAINLSLDLPASKLNSGAVSRLKMLTGGDAVNINQKYEQEFRYINRAKFVFATNSPISISENDEAFWKRLVYLPFNRSIPKKKQNPALLEIFLEEKNAIVSKALHYAKALIELDFEFPKTSEISRKMQEWKGIFDISIDNFVKECCRYDKDYKGELVETLYIAYEEYCQNNSYIPKNRRLFKNLLETNYELKHFKMRNGGVNPQSAFRHICLCGGD